MSKDIQVNVTVHKAAIPIGAKESVGDFTQAIHKAAQDHVVKKLGVKTYDCWPREVFGDSVVMSCYLPDGKGSKLYQMTYTRAKDGSFSFGDLIEVQAKTSYVPVVSVFGTGVSVSKAAENVTPAASEVAPAAKAVPSDRPPPAPGQPIRRSRPAPPRPENTDA